MVTMLKNKYTACKRNKFLSFWYHSYYFTLLETCFIHLETLLINHLSQFCIVLSPQKYSASLVLFCAGCVSFEFVYNLRSWMTIFHGLPFVSR